MFTHGFDPELYIEARRIELMEEAMKHHLVQIALQSRQGKSQGFAKILAMAGKWLSGFGARLENHYGAQPQAVLDLKQ